MEKYDAIVIGFGKGGKTLAADLSGRGRRVALIERSEEMYGGTCINVGCIPTKFLIRQAKPAAARPERDFEAKRDFYRRAAAAKDELTASLRAKNYRSLADRPNVDVYTGTGSFVSADTVAVSSAAGKIRLTAPLIFIDTGAESVVPPIPGIRESRFAYTSTSILDLKELPHRLVVVGGGYIGLEFASMFASFGSAVTVLEGGTELIPREDRDIAAEVRRVLEKKGIGFRTGVRVESVRDESGEAVVAYTADGTQEEIRADAVLLATGRRPATAELNLEAAGVETDDRGAVRVDERLRTTAPGVYALGDVKGGPQFTYISLDDYRIVRDHLFGEGKRGTKDREPVSYSVFIDPPLSRIGMSEEEARRAGRNVRVKAVRVDTIPRARTLGDTEGQMKAVIDAETDEILGCTLFCAESSEAVNTVAVAMKAGLKASFLRDFIFTHPSMSETFNDLFE